MITLYFAPRTRSVRIRRLLDDRHTQLTRYLERLQARPAFQAAVDA